MERVQLYEPLRVSQLDALELDNQLLDLFKIQLKNIFKFYKSHLLYQYDSEVNLLLGLLIWHYSLNKSGSTIGQNLLSLKYININRLPHKSTTTPTTELSSSPSATSTTKSSSTKTNNNNDTLQMTKKQKYVMVILSTILPWCHDKIENLSMKFKHFESLAIFHQSVKLLESLVKFAKLINFLIFLRKGHYVSVTERLLGIRSMFTHVQSARQLSFEMTDREILWNGFTEFLFFMLPLVNYQKIKRTIEQRIIRPLKIRSKPSTAASLNESNITINKNFKFDEENLKNCAICSEWPINPRHINCSHVFCYYCVHSNFKADNGFCCPVCFHPIGRLDNIQSIPVSSM